MEFFNAQQEKEDTIYSKMGGKIVAIDRHVIIDVLKISNTKWNEQECVDKQIVEAMFQGVVLFIIYINEKQWNVSQMEKPYPISFLALIKIIYQRNKVYYFSNRNVISIMTQIKESMQITQTLCKDNSIKKLPNGQHQRLKCPRVQ